MLIQINYVLFIFFNYFNHVNLPIYSINVINYINIYPLVLNVYDINLPYDPFFSSKLKSI